MTEPQAPLSPIKRGLLWLWNPFTKTAGVSALIAGIIIILISAAIAVPSETHFDGVLDTHLGSGTPIWFFFAEGIVNWLSLALVLWISGLILCRKYDRKFRAIDLFGTQALARWPFLIISLVCLIPGVSRAATALAKMTVSPEGIPTLPEIAVGDTLAFTFASIVMLIATIWFVAMSWKAFRISCDVSGWRAISAFMVSLILAEIISKIVITKGLVALI